MLEQALKYKKLGLSVLPCKPDKHPYVTWTKYQKERASEEQIESWWRKFRKSNAGIVCGDISGVDVLDIDSREAYESITENFLPESLETPTLSTPSGGYQLWFRHRPGLINRANYMPQIDIRTTGGFAVVPISNCEYEKNGVIIKGSHKWLNGLDPRRVPAAPWPDILFDTLKQCLNNNKYNNNYCINNTANAVPENNGCPQVSTVSTNVHNLFDEGHRDDDIFHVAYSLARGRCNEQYALKTLEIICNSCNPPMPINTAREKWKSALNRLSGRERNLAQEIREWVLSTNGVFLSTDVYSCLQLSTREERKNVSTVLSRMESEKLVEKSGRRNGEWRLIDQDCQPLDWINANCEYKELWLPLGLDHICGVQPGNVLVFAGAKDSGKTAWLMNVAKENRHSYKVHYFNSEMGVAEWKMRASKFDDISLEQFAKGVNLYDRNANFHDVIKPGEGNLNIIDFLEVPDEVWRVVSMIQKIHSKLNGALCVIALQKKIGQDLGRGAEFSMEKARLYVSLDYQKAKIISCKNFKENDHIAGNPRGYTCRFKLVNGCKILKQPPGWASELKEE